MTPTVNVDEHTTYTNLLHFLHNRLSEFGSVMSTYKFMIRFCY